MFNQLVPNTYKIFQQDFPKVAILKRSTKGAMSSSFLRASCTKPSIRKKLAEMQCLSKWFQVMAKFLSKTFPK